LLRSLTSRADPRWPVSPQCVIANSANNFLGGYFHTVTHRGETHHSVPTAGRERTPLSPVGRCDFFAASLGRLSQGNNNPARRRFCRVLRCRAFLRLTDRGRRDEMGRPANLPIVPDEFPCSVEALIPAGGHLPERFCCRGMWALSDSHRDRTSITHNSFPSGPPDR